MDVAGEKSTNKMVRKTVDRFGKIDILVNNVALFANVDPKPFYEITSNEWDDVIRVCLMGTSRVTSEFAVDAIGRWCKTIGSDHYRSADHLLILADCGGSKSYRTRLWKDRLQNAFCSPHNLHVKVCHYLPGSSKWKPIEHNMFSFISGNWSGRPLADYETALKFIRTTKTVKRLKVHAVLNTKKYEKGVKVTDKQMQNVNLKR